MSEIKMLPLYAELQGHPKLEIIKHYARAVAEHNVKERDAEIEALRAEVRDAYAAADSKAGWEWKKRAEQAEARAERLAEALRDALECGNDGDWQSARQYITAALRDHDQEGKDG